MIGGPDRPDPDPIRTLNAIRALHAGHRDIRRHLDATGPFHRKNGRA